MYVRIERLVAAGNELKSLIERAGGDSQGEFRAVLANWDRAVEEMLNKVEEVLPKTAIPGQDTGDFDYLAFDGKTQALIGFGSHAIYALQYADEAAPESEISILSAGTLGRRIWDQKLDFALAHSLVKAFSGAGGDMGGT